MAKENKTKDKAPVKEKPTQKKQQAEKPVAVAETTEAKPAEKVAAPVKKKKKVGIFRSIFNGLIFPFVWVYDRIVLAITNTLRRICNAITGVCRAIKNFFWNIFTKLWEIMKKVWVVLKKVLIVLLVLGVIVGGFFLGMYLRLFNVDDVNRKLSLYKWPIIGENFVEPPPLEEPVAEQGSESAKDKNGKIEDVRPKNAEAKSAPIKVTKEEIEKQMKEAAAAEKKRVTKLARLYENMKPQEAATIMNDLDDVVIVAILQRMDESQAAKILAKIDPVKSARLTKIIFGGSTSFRRGQTNR